MANPHIIRRKDRGGVFYLVEGELFRSLKTKHKGLAEYRLREYIKGQFKTAQSITVKEYYDKWIETKRAPLIRKSAARDYMQHFKRYLLPTLGSRSMTALTVTSLSELRADLSTPGLSLKTIRNLLDGSFRAMWRDAMQEGIVQHNPFTLLKWPRVKRERPDPFTAEERDAILNYWADSDAFYYPWLLTLFYTGMRPSEASALRWRDVNLETGMISIGKSRYMGEEKATKTAGSERTIGVYPFVIKALSSLLSLKLHAEYVFVNKYGDPMNAKKWSEHNWGKKLNLAGIRHRKFYATRHTFITECVKAGHNLKAIADYCGTSVAMIEKDYCGQVALTLFQPQQSNPVKTLVAGPGFEPDRVSDESCFKLINIENFKGMRRRKVA